MTSISTKNFLSFHNNSYNDPIKLLYIYHKICIHNTLFYKQLIGDYILLSIPKYMYMYLLHNFEDITCYITTQYINNYIHFINLHTTLQYQYLLDITAADYYNQKYRFQLTYNLISHYLNNRLNSKIITNETNKINSIHDILPGASWYEREILDFFGIIFNNNNDLRRLLTDYAFEGYPLKKDFPLSGFLELRYNEQIKRLGYYNIKTIQEYKTFELINPWNVIHKFKFGELQNLYLINKNKPLHSEFLYNITN